jgi:tetratricopeptide (TPR) repeat protein
MERAPLKPDASTRLIAALALAWMLGACGMTAPRWSFYRALLEVDVLADDGHYAEARQGYRALASKSDRLDLLSYVRFREAYMYELEGRYEEALAAYGRIYTAPQGLYDHEAGQALYRTAVVLRDAYGDEEEATRTLQAVVETFPNTFYADDALMDLIDQWRARGESRRIYAFLTSRYVPLQRTEIADNLAYWTGRVLQDDLSDPESAIRVYEILILNFHPSSLVDDSVWRTALAYRTLGRVDEEVRLLRAFLDAREVSWIMADYESEYYKPSLERLAEVHEERGELSQAIGVWERFQKMYPLSLRRDDVQYHIMELQLERGDIEGMRESLAWLEREYPESRYIRRGVALIESATEVAP